MSRAVRANIDASVNNLHLGSDILKDLVAEKGLIIIGAEYCLDTGAVNFIE
jgi:carbonic anhydrase